MINKIKKFLFQKKMLFINLLIITFFFSIDIWTKRLAFNKVDYIYQKTAGIHTYIKINDYFNIVKVINTGVSFGMFNNLKYGQIILSLITFLILAFVIYLLYKSNTKYKSITYSLIIAGGLGNIYDRIFYGGVFDFLDFHIGKYHWPAFNIADSIICIAVFLLLFEEIIIKLFAKKNI